MIRNKRRKDEETGRRKSRKKDKNFLINSPFKRPLFVRTAHFEDEPYFEIYVSYVDLENKPMEKTAIETETLCNEVIPSLIAETEQGNHNQSVTSQTM